MYAPLAEGFDRPRIGEVAIASTTALTVSVAARSSSSVAGRCAERALVAGRAHGPAVGGVPDRAQLAEDIGAQLPPDRVGLAAERPGRLERLPVTAQVQECGVLRPGVLVDGERGGHQIGDREATQRNLAIIG